MRPALVAVVALTAWLASPPAGAVYQSPQVLSLNALRTASTGGLELAVSGGGVRTMKLDVGVGGTTPVARANSFLRSYGPLFTEADPDLSLELARSDGMPGGGDVTVFVQKVRGIPIFGSRLMIGFMPAAAGGPASRVKFVSSNVLPAVQLETRPALSAASAVDVARLALGAFGAPTLVAPKLAVLDPRTFGETGAPSLVWSFVLLGDGSVRPPKRVLVDAADGALELVYDLEYEAVTDLDLLMLDANGLQNTDTTCVQNRSGIALVGSVLGLLPPYQSNVDAIAGWNAIRATYLLYSNRFAYDSWDDDDAPIPLTIDSGVDNGMYSSGCDNIQIRTGWMSLDVIGHEFTHGVINHSPSDLVYEGQSGALNESYADTMGSALDDDWLLAEDRTNGDGAIRSMADPPGKYCGLPSNLQNCGDPDRMSIYVDTDEDNGGVHTNSGIPNKAHYLLAQGGSFNGLNVVGIGRVKMSWIAFMTMRFLPSTATFMDARNLSITAAVQLAGFNLGGITTADVCSVRNAWAAVEVGFPDANCDGAEEGGSDSDFDGVGNFADNCDFVANPDQDDWNNDGTGDVCDPSGDDDNDGLPNAIDKCPHDASPDNGDYDGDGIGNPCDDDNDNDGVADDVDNCPDDYNPSQFDGNDNGEGDACDPDFDGDGLYALDDNCTFAFNPGQQDADGDGMGDACDDCPNVSDNMGAYTDPLFGDPEPFQPDSDGDGIPDACDEYGFGDVSATVDGATFNPKQPVKPDGRSRPTIVAGPAGASAKIPILPCDPLDADGLTKDERVELVFVGLDDLVDARVLDASGRTLGHVEPGTLPSGGPAKGVRFKPLCGEGHFLEVRFLPGFGGSDPFTWLPRVVLATGPNPWTGVDPTVYPPPGSLPDADRDGLIDAIDTCPAVANPENLDNDGDGKGDACDNCPSFANADQLDRGGLGAGSLPNGRGDACECGDVNDDGRVTTADASMMQRALLVPPTATMTKPYRCDVGGSAGCSTSDVAILKRALLTPPAATIQPKCVP